ncbi:J domain-containing protein [Streptacidiphilus melanogenes]|uniref:J domain-containing protein n=1 Tax=Streptacidiphilus melanogenes TaxID=411235 RepID=UPI000B1E8662|nr:J domain-containing protein [Streptacidiphilus melanogenes]
MEAGRDPATAARRVLGLGPSADLEQVTQAYRTLARAWHPDTNPDPAAPARLAQVVAAYRLLKHQAQAGTPPHDSGRAPAPAPTEPVHRPLRPRGAAVVAGPVRIHPLPPRD